MLKKENLSYGVLGYGRKNLVGIVGMGHSAGATLTSKVMTKEIAKRGLKDRVLVIDNPTNYDEMDIVVLVIDPLPSKIKDNLDIYAELRSYYDGERKGRNPKIYFLLNKMNSGVDIKELERFLKINFIYIQNMIPIEKIYEAEFNDISVESRFDFGGIIDLSEELFSSAGR